MTDEANIDPRRQSYLMAIDSLRCRWENTRNPLFVLQAIEHCFAMQNDMAAARSGDIAEDYFARCEPFPDWCIPYVGLVVTRIGVLRSGRDFRDFPPPIGNGTTAPKSWSVAWRDAGHLEATDAADLLPQALGLVRPGGNSFRDFNSISEKEGEYHRYQGIRHAASSPKAAMEEHLENLKIPPSVPVRVIDGLDGRLTVQIPELGRTGRTDDDESLVIPEESVARKRLRKVEATYGVKPKRPRKAKPSP